MNNNKILSFIDKLKSDTENSKLSWGDLKKGRHGKVFSRFLNKVIVDFNLEVKQKKSFFVEFLENDSKLYLLCFNKVNFFIDIDSELDQADKFMLVMEQKYYNEIYTLHSFETFQEELNELFSVIVFNNSGIDTFLDWYIKDF